MTDKSIWQAQVNNVGTPLEGGIPDHTHTYTATARRGRNGTSPTVAWWSSGDSADGTAIATFTNASESNSVYGRYLNNQVVPTSMCIIFLIKF